MAEREDRCGVWRGKDLGWVGGANRPELRYYSDQYVGSVVGVVAWVGGSCRPSVRRLPPKAPRYVQGSSP